MLRLAVLSAALVCVALVADGVEGGRAGPPGISESGCYRRCRDGKVCIRGSCQCPAGRYARGATGRKRVQEPVGDYEGPCCDSGCLNGGTCSGHNRCTCRSGYTGYRCQIRTCSPACRNGAVCSYGSCRCKPGYSGSYCQTKVCSPSCRNGKVCTNGRCQCPADRYRRGAPGPRPKGSREPVGYPESDRRIKGIEIKGIEEPRGYEDSFYEGACCDNDCLNGGTCSGHNQCACRSGYSGYRCQIRICSPSCRNGKICVSGQCRCPARIYDAYVPLPKGYGERDGGPGSYDSRNSRPRGNVGAPGPDGEQGIKGIQGPAGSLRGDYEGACCDNDCLNGGTCSGHNQCTCRSGYTGYRCQIRSNICSPSCRNGKICVSGQCRCPARIDDAYVPLPKGYGERDGGPGSYDSRNSRPRGNVGAPGPDGEQGIKGIQGPAGSPRGDYNGVCCEDDCLNGGTCSGHNQCTCRPGYTGSRCQTREAVVDCTGCRVRKEIHDLTQAERELFINTYKAAYQRQDFRLLIQHHWVNFGGVIHQSAEFLPWHRWYILQVENILREIDCRIVMPYWDWSLKSSNPWSEPIWGSAPDRYGGDGGGSCVTTGPFRQGQFTLISGGCLRRQFEGNTPDPLQINDFLSQPVSDFDLRVEYALRASLHFVVHCAINGTMCSTLAAETPEFFLHHTFIDKLWHDWQSKSPAHRDVMFSTRTQPMTAAGGVTPRDVVDLNKQPGQVCVRYQQPQRRDAQRLRGQLGRVSAATIAKHLPCTPNDLSQSPALQRGFELFGVSPTDRARVAMSLRRRVCKPVSGPAGQAGPSGGNAGTPDLGFNLADLEALV